MNERVRVSLRPDREIELFASSELDVVRNRTGIEIQVGVHQRDPLPVRCERAGLDCVALAEVAVVVDDPHAGATGGEKPLRRVVDRSVGNDDGLDLVIPQALGDAPPNDLHVADDLVAPVVDRDDHRQQRSRPHCGDLRRRGVRRRRRNVRGSDQKLRGAPRFDRQTDGNPNPTAPRS